MGSKQHHSLPDIEWEHVRRGRVRKPDCCLRPVAECASAHRLRGNWHRALRDCGSFPVAGRRASTAVRVSRTGTATSNKDGFRESSSVVARRYCDEPAAGGEFLQELRILVSQSWLFGTKESPCGADEAPSRHLHHG